MTNLTDEQIAEQANAMIDADKYVSENQIHKKLGVTKRRIQLLIKAGKIKPLTKLSKSQASALSRKRNGTFKHWKIDYGKQEQRV